LKNGTIFWQRSKTEGKNDFRTCHRLWDETASLLRRHLCNGKTALRDSNNNALALQTPTRKPWHSLSPKGDALDYVGKYWYRTMKLLKGQNLKSDFRFMDCRKTTSSALAELSQQVRISQQFRQEAIPGVSKFYNQLGCPAFNEMNGWLTRYGEQLRTAGAFKAIQMG
jgi:hypothetical protein